MRCSAAPKLAVLTAFELQKRMTAFPHMLQVLNAARKARLRVFLCIASSIPSRRLRDLEVDCARSEGSVGAKELSQGAKPEG